MKKRLIAMALCLLMLVGFLPLTTAEAANAEDEPMRFVMVLDCSNSMLKQDPNNLCAKASDIFVSLMPVENARVGVVGLGNTGVGTDYAMQVEEVQLEKDQKNDIKILQPLEDAEIVKEQGIGDDIKKAVDSSSAVITPIGNGLLTALDMMEADGTPDGKGCIILVSDGHAASYHTPLQSEQLADNVAKKAGSKEWPIYTLQLHAIADEENGVNYDSNNKKCMTNWAKVSGGTYYELTKDILQGDRAELEVTKIFTDIFDGYMDADGGTEIVSINGAGEGETKIEIPILTSEAKIIVTGSAIQSVDLVSPNNEITKITGKTDGTRLMATVKKGAFVSITMISPLSGIWTVVVHGDPNAQVLRYSYSVQDPELVLRAPDYKGEILSKVDTVDFILHYEFRGEIIPAEDQVYTVKQPMLVIANENGRELDEKPGLSNCSQGYIASVDMSKLGTGTFTVTAVLASTGSTVRSNSIQIKVENKESTIAGGTDAVLPDRTAFVHEGFDDFSRIDLEGKISNTDGDELIFTVESASGRDLRVDPECNGIDYKIEDGYLYLTAGDVVAEYEIHVGFRDEDETEFTYFEPFTFTVTQREFSYTAPKNLELWCDEYSWYKDVATPQPKSAELDLTDSYSDPDGDELIISDVKVKITPANDKVEEVLDWDYDEKTGELTVDSLGEGTGVVSYTVSDGYTEEDITFSIKVVSGKARFWTQNLKWFILTVIVIAVLVITLIFISSITRIKGNCEVTFENETQMTRVAPIKVKLNNLRCTRNKKSCSFKDLINAVAALISQGDDPNNVIPQVQSAISNQTAKKVNVRGVATGRGFTIDKNFGDANFNVESKARNAKVRVGAGQSVYIKLTDTASGEIIKITMRVK